MRIIYILILTIILSCNNQESKSEDLALITKSYLDFECILLSSKSTDSSNVIQKQYLIDVKNLTNDTIYLNANDTIIRFHSWNYSFLHDDQIEYDSIEYCNHFSDFEFPILRNSTKRFIYIVGSPFLSDNFWIKYKFKEKIYKVKSNCK